MKVKEGNVVKTTTRPIIYGQVEEVDGDWIEISYGLKETVLNKPWWPLYQYCDVKRDELEFIREAR